jgi:hypothetical protein
MRKFNAILIVCLVILATMPLSVSATGFVTPDTVVADIKAGDTENDVLHVALPAKPAKGDVVFIFDATGSMGTQIASAKANALTIMNNVRLSVPDTNFGVGSFTDYPHTYTAAQNYGYANDYGYSAYGDYAWQKDQDLTTSTAAVQAAINGLSIKSGGDTPQDYARALYESQFFSWRPDAKKIVVIIGDAPPHAQPNGASLPAVFVDGAANHYYGGDPGVDEVMGTSDDLDFKTVVQSLKSAGITVIAADCSAGKTFGADAQRAFQYEADQTGGSRFVYTDSTIATDIVAKINAATSADIKQMTVTVREPAYASWVVVNPTSYYGVPWGESRDFNVAITPPLATPPGPFTIHLDVYGDGQLLGTTTISKTIPSETPEFPTLALPVAMLLGFVFIVYSVKSKKEEN